MASKLFFYAVLIGGSFLLFYFAAISGSNRSYKLPPRMLMALPGNRVEAEKALTEALTEKYPYETPEEKVIQSLKEEGFRIEFDEKAHRSYAIYVSTIESNSDASCHGYALIDWDMTQDHRIKRFHVSQPVQCGDIYSRPPLP